MSEQAPNTTSSNPNAATALIIVDVQPDFCPGGALGTTDGDLVAHRIAHHLQLPDSAQPSGSAALAATPNELPNPRNYDYVLTTQDWHIEPAGHFSDNPDFQDTWPVHCVAGTPGAELHPALAQLRADAHIYKGEFTAAYSGFEGHVADSAPAASLSKQQWESQHHGQLSLSQWLHQHGVSQVFLCGIATDFCVRATALDALDAGFQVSLYPALCSGVHAEGSQATLEELERKGVELTLT